MFFFLSFFVGGRVGKRLGSDVVQRADVDGKESQVAGLPRLTLLSNTVASSLQVLPRQWSARSFIRASRW